MIAKVFSQYDNDDEYLIFASGVSNSKNNILSNFEREKKLLINNINNHIDKTFIYFSSCSLSSNLLSQDMYHKHKKKMEDIIKNRTNKYIIFRLPNVVGYNLDNQNTLLNFLINSIINKKEFTIWTGAVRNIIDIDDAFNIIKYILENKIYINEIIEVANTSNIAILDLIYEIETYFLIKSSYISIYTENEKLLISNCKIYNIIKILDIKFDKNYIKNILDKYYKELKR